MKPSLKVTIALITCLVFYTWWYTIKTNWIVFTTVMRGILTTRCTWWTITNRTTSDVTGVNVYRKLKQNHKVYKMNIMGRTIHIVMDEQFIKAILDQSPQVFGVGAFKYDFFKSFMRLNVGVSEGCPWKRRRVFNEFVLDRYRFPRHTIAQILSNNFPTTFQEFRVCGKLLSSKVVFGTLDVYEPIYKLFAQANSIRSVLTGHDTIPVELKAQYKTYLNYFLDNPIPGSMIDLCLRSPTRLSREEIIDQIPHWIFPITGVVTNGLPRLVLMLLNTPRTLSKVHDTVYLRHCILEMFRLNNPVNSTFRSSLQEYAFDPQHIYPAGTQFLIINNPVMRDPEIFPRPNEFIPERWTPALENSYYSLMFNQGPQKCPGKEFVIDFLAKTTQVYLSSRTITGFEPKLDSSNIPQMINPCVVKFFSNP